MRNRWAAAALAGLAWAATAGAADPAPTTIFDGRTPAGWITSKGKPLPTANVQPDGLNPRKSGGYLIVHEAPHGNFELDFEYKIAPGCNSGVFLRAADLNDPVNTGIEVAIEDDTVGTGLHSPGAFYDLAAPEVNAQRPAGEWNRMVIRAEGPKISINLNGRPVSKIDLDRFTEAGARPDGSKHKFSKVIVKEMARTGYLGFQDHGGDCWFRAIKIRDLP